MKVAINGSCKSATKFRNEDKENVSSSKITIILQEVCVSVSSDFAVSRTILIRFRLFFVRSELLYWIIVWQ